MPVVVLAGDPEQARLLVRDQADDYAVKPYPETLLVRLGAIVGRRRAESARAAADARFRAVFEHAPTGMALASPDGRLLEVNAALARLLGLPRDAPIEPTIDGLTHPDDLLDGPVSLVPGDDEVMRLERRLLAADGRIVPATLTISVIREEAAPRQLVVQVEESRSRGREAWVLVRVLTAQLARCVRYDERAALLLVEVNDLDAVEDAAARLRVAAAVAGAMRARLRRSDVLVPLGERRFAALLVNAGAPAALAVARGVRAAVEETAVPDGDAAARGGRGVRVRRERDGRADRRRGRVAPAPRAARRTASRSPRAARRPQEQPAVRPLVWRWTSSATTPSRRSSTSGPHSTPPTTARRPTAPPPGPAPRSSTACDGAEPWCLTVRDGDGLVGLMALARRRRATMRVLRPLGDEHADCWDVLALPEARARRRAPPRRGAAPPQRRVGRARPDAPHARARRSRTRSPARGCTRAGTRASRTRTSRCPRPSTPTSAASRASGGGGCASTCSRSTQARSRSARSRRPRCPTRSHGCWSCAAASGSRRARRCFPRSPRTASAAS